MSYEKIDYHNISWIKKGALYRGHNQGLFEYALLKSFLENGGEKAEYTGWINSPGNITFTTPHPAEAVRFAHDWIEDIIEETTPPILTQHPIILEINAQPYKEFLYRSLNGEGVIIMKPVSIDDIQVLYSSRNDRLEELLKLAKKEHVKEPFRKLIEVFRDETEEAISGRTKDILREYKEENGEKKREIAIETYLLASGRHNLIEEEVPEALRFAENYFRMLERLFSERISRR